VNESLSVSPLETLLPPDPEKDLQTPALPDFSNEPTANFFGEMANFTEIRILLKRENAEEDTGFPPAVRLIARPASWKIASSPASILATQYASASQRAKTVLAGSEKEH